VWSAVFHLLFWVRFALLNPVVCIYDHEDGFAESSFWRTRDGLIIRVVAGPKSVMRNLIVKQYRESDVDTHCQTQDRAGTFTLNDIQETTSSSP